ncbi:uncharacterized protein METZ01_LOCUS493245, partial [marine metagenome]
QQPMVCLCGEAFQAFTTKLLQKRVMLG